MPSHAADGVRCQGCDERPGYGHLFDCPVRIRALEIDAERWRQSYADNERLREALHKIASAWINPEQASRAAAELAGIAYDALHPKEDRP